MDARTFQAFYCTALGRYVAQQLATHVTLHWPDLSPHHTLVGAGYAAPVLAQALLMRGHPGLNPCYLSLAHHGVVCATDAPYESQVLVEDTLWPVAEASVHAYLGLHFLESVRTPLESLREVYRVLLPQGRCFMIVPAAQTLWSVAEGQPFSLGRAFSRARLVRLFQQVGFEVLHVGHALHGWPTQSRLSLALQGRAELYLKDTPFLAGVHVIHARKSLLGPVRVVPRRRLSVGRLPAFQPM
jgi:hypothetical protein